MLLVSARRVPAAGVGLGDRSAMRWISFVRSNPVSTSSAPASWACLAMPEGDRRVGDDPGEGAVKAGKLSRRCPATLPKPPRQRNWKHYWKVQTKQQPAKKNPAKTGPQTKAEFELKRSLPELSPCVSRNYWRLKRMAFRSGSHHQPIAASPASAPNAREHNLAAGRASWASSRITKIAATTRLKLAEAELTSGGRSKDRCRSRQRESAAGSRCGNEGSRNSQSSRGTTERCLHGTWHDVPQGKHRAKDAFAKWMYDQLESALAGGESYLAAACRFTALPNVFVDFGLRSPSCRTARSAGGGAYGKWLEH